MPATLSTLNKDTLKNILDSLSTADLLRSTSVSKHLCLIIYEKLFQEINIDDFSLHDSGLKCSYNHPSHQQQQHNVSRSATRSTVKMLNYLLLQLLQRSPKLKKLSGQNG